MSLVSANHRHIKRGHHLQTGPVRRRRSFTKCKVSFATTAGGNCDLHRLLSAVWSTLFMPSGYRISPWRHTLDSERSIFCCYGEEWMLQYADIRLHPGMLIAFYWNQH